MDNVKRLSQLVDGNVGHVKVLARYRPFSLDLEQKSHPSLGQNQHWKPIIEFLSDNDLDSERKILLIRRLVNSYSS